MRAGFCFSILVFGACLLRAEIIDRIAISVGNQVITERQIDQDVRLTAFLNEEKLDLDLAARKKAAGRLIEQTLIRREIELSRYPLPEMSEAQKSLEKIRARYASEAAYQKALEAYGIDESALLERLWWQETFLRFIEYRFRPGILIQDADVQAYYQKQLENWKKQGVERIPSLDEVRAKIEQTLTEQRIDQDLERWLSETRKQVAIRYHDQELAAT